MRQRTANPSRLLVLLSIIRAARPNLRETATHRRVRSVDTSAHQLHVQLPDMVPAGTRVPFGIMITNTGGQSSPLDLVPGTVAYEIEIFEPGGRPVRTLSGGVGAGHAGRTLAPGDTLTFEGQWDQRDTTGRPVTPARYEVRVTIRLAADRERWESRIRTLAIAP